MGSLTGMAETGLVALARVDPGQEWGTDSPATCAPWPRPAAT
ncbi:hypothetical protein [Mycobacterium conspicuum]